MWKRKDSYADLDKDWDEDSHSVQMSELQPQSDEEMNPLNEDSAGVQAEMHRLKIKHRKLKRSFHCLLIFSCTMVLLILFFSYRAYQGYYVPEDSGDDNDNNTSTAYTQLAEQVLADMDPTADPCEDFYQYACGGWLARTTLGADEMRAGRSFDAIKAQNDETLLAMLHNDSLPYLSGLFSVCMNTSLAEDNSAQHEMFTLIGGATNLTELYQVSARLRLEYGFDLGMFFSLSLSIDDEQPTRYLPMLWQQSPLLPDASYYADAALVQSYQDWIAEAYTAAGIRSPPASIVEQIVQLELALLDNSNSPAENRDPEAIYNIVPANELESLLQDAALYVQTLLPDATEFNVAQMDYFRELYSTLNRFEYVVLYEYAVLRCIVHTQSLFGQAQRASAQSFGSMLYNIDVAPAREDFCVGAAQSLAGMRMAYFYVQREFDERSRSIVEDMIVALESSYVETVQQLDWMDEATRLAAIDKLDAIRNMVGYPDEWPEWTAPDEGSTLFEYYRNALVERQRASLALLSQPVDDTQWEMLPSEVNAYYEPVFNMIVFPAGILQWPFFSSQQPVAANYGGIGSVIGHELGHSLDDQGSQYTANGTLDDWWSVSSRAAFESAAQCVSDLYSSYEVEPGLNVNGELVLGESIADLGGLRQAYAALQQWKLDYAAQAASEESAVQSAYGMSSNELFFLSFGQNWCQKSTRGYQVMLTETNPHPLSNFRVLGSLSQSDEFAETYSCTAGATYNPEEKCQIW